LITGVPIPRSLLRFFPAGIKLRILPLALARGLVSVGFRGLASLPIKARYFPSEIRKSPFFHCLQIFSGKSPALWIDFTSNSSPRRRGGIKRKHNINQEKQKFLMAFIAFFLPLKL
jgi:hypothetical protein